MVVLLDTGILYAYYDRADRWHSAAVLAIADSLDVRRIATTDRRDFGAVAEELSLELVP